MEESKDYLCSVPKQRQHSVRPIIEKLKNTFAMKFENPVVERTSDSITNEVTNNWQVLRTLTKNIQDDLLVNRLGHLSECITQIQDFTEYMIKLMSRSLVTLYESNSLLLKGKTAAIDGQTKMCSVCFKQVEEVRIKNLRDKLESMNHFKKEETPTIQELYMEQERLSFEEDGISSFDAILRELIVGRDRVAYLNNDRTIQALKEFLKSMLSDAQSLQAESSSEQFFLTKFKCGKDIVNDLYLELTKNVKNIAKKDVFPLVYKLSQQFAEKQKERIQKNMKSTPSQTDAIVQKPKNIKKNSNASIRSRDQIRHEDHCCAHRRNTNDEDDSNRSSANYLKQANLTRMSSFRKKNTSQHLTSLNCSNRNFCKDAESKSSNRQISNKSVQVQISGQDCTKQGPSFEDKQIQTYELCLTSNRTLMNTRTFLRDNASQHSMTNINFLGNLPTFKKSQICDNQLGKDQNSKGAYDQTIKQEKQSFHVQNIKTQQVSHNSPAGQSCNDILNQKLKKSPNKIQGVRRSKEKHKTLQTDPSQHSIGDSNKIRRLKKKARTRVSNQNISRKNATQQTEVQQQIVNKIQQQLALNKFSKQRAELAKVNRVMSFNKKPKYSQAQLQRQLSLKDPPDFHQTACESQVLKELQGNASRKSLDIEEFIKKMSEKMQKLFAPKFGKKIQQLLIYSIENKEWIDKVDLAKILERLNPIKPKNRSPQRKKSYQSPNLPFSKDKNNSSKRKNTPVQGNRPLNKIHSSDISSLFKSPLGKPFFMSQTPHVSLHRQSVVKLPAIVRTPTEPYDRSQVIANTTLAQKLQVGRQAMVNLIKSDQTNNDLVSGQNSHSTTVFRPRSRRDPYNNFTLEDLQVFGGFEGSYHFESLFTKNSLKKRIFLSELQSSEECKALAAAVYNHLEGIWNESKLRYQCIKSFLRYPYQTVCNDYVGLEVNQHMSLLAIEQVFGIICGIHNKCTENGLCGHIQAFLKKIGLDIETKQ